MFENILVNIYDWQEYSKLGDRRSDGSHITLSQSDKWLKQVFFRKMDALEENVNMSIKESFKNEVFIIKSHVCIVTFKSLQKKKKTHNFVRRQEWWMGGLWQA